MAEMESSSNLMKRTLSSAGYGLTQRENDNLGCPSCGNETGLDAFLGAHRCCYCADGGRVSNGRVLLPCPECSGGSANPEIREDPVKRMGIPWKYQEATFATWKPDNGRERIVCQNFALAWPPPKPLLFLTGNRGAGKTTLAIAILRKVYEDRRIAGQFWLAGRLLDRINATYDEEATETLQQVISQLEKVALLVIDDFGSEKSTEAARARLFSIIDHRYSHGKPLIVTSNTDLMTIDQRVKSRLSDAAISEIVQFRGRDMRPEARGT